MNYYKISHFNPCIISETACGHDGSFKKLKQLIEIAHQSGSKTIKFQIYKLNERSNQNTKEEKIFKKLLLTNSEWENAVKIAHKKNMFVFADVFGYESFNLAKKINVDGFKIHSEDSLNFKFIESVLNSNKITILGVGGSHRIEINSLLEYIKKKKLLRRVILMTGVQTFPTPLQAHSISEITDLVKKYSQSEVKIGFSDHVHGGTQESYILPIMAISAGASFIEKHFTTDRKLKQTDFQSSLNRNELKIFFDLVKKYEKILQPVNQFNKWEKSYRSMFKKSPVIINEKKKGEKINSNEIIFKKNTKKPQSLNIEHICNKKLLQDIKPNTNMSLQKIEQRIGIIIVARNSSNRFPKKALGKICGRESIACLIDRMKKVKNANEIILATSKSKSDNILEKIAKRENIKCFRGSLNNVASRYYKAAKKFKLDQIVRITGDAILADEKMIDKAITAQIKKGTDVTFMKNMPYGTAKEVFNMRTIKAIAKYSLEPDKTEYLEWFLENNRNFKVGYIKSNYNFDKNIRLTLDYKEDLLQLNKIYKGLKRKKYFDLYDVLGFLKKNKNVIKINSYLRPKFNKKEINTNLSI